MDPLKLHADEALDLAHHWLTAEHEWEPDERQRLDQELIGPLSTLAGAAPRESWAPDWWDDDEDAAASSMAAMRALGGAMEVTG